MLLARILPLLWPLLLNVEINTNLRKLELDIHHQKCLSARIKRMKTACATC